MNNRFLISRRTALRGLGVSMALPVLEAMRPARGGTSAARTGPPIRLAYLYVPNGVHMPDWTPPGEFLTPALPAILRPLEPFREDLLVIGGLTLDPARPHGDGGGDHARAMAAFLTGRHPRKTDGADLRAGVSADQVAASHLAGSTRFASLELGCEGSRGAGACDHGYSCAYQSNLSWRGESTPVAKEIDPGLVFDRLFGDRSAGVGEKEAERRDRRTRGVLDFVAEDARRLRARLGSADRRKLDEYLEDVRDVERRLDRSQPADPGSDTRTRPAGIPSDPGAHIRLMADVLVLAFRADLTRVATFVFANDGSNRSSRSIGVADGHHDLSHHGGDPAKQAKIRAINAFQVEQLAYFLGRLRSIPEGAGTLLDHSMIVYGSGIRDGDAHDHADLPILVAGKGGGTLRTGRFVRFPRETPLANLHLAMLDRLGAAPASLGDSTGRLGSLG